VDRSARRPGRIAIAGSVLTTLLIASPPVNASEQLDARTEPSYTAPLSDSNESYSGQRCQTEHPEADGVVTARIRFCRTFLRFDPGSETDTTNDYGVWWIQANIKAMNGWCVSRGRATLGMEEGFTPSAVLETDLRSDNATEQTVTFVSEAGGTAVAPATVQQSLITYKGRYRSFWEAETSTYVVKWRGSTKRKIALAGGIEGSWDTTVGPGVFLPGAGADVTNPC
jgi:hypothetical protein